MSAHIPFQVSPKQNWRDWSTPFTQIPVLGDMLLFVTSFFSPPKMNLDIHFSEKTETEREKWKEERGEIL